MTIAIKTQISRGHITIEEEKENTKTFAEKERRTRPSSFRDVAAGRETNYCGLLREAAGEVLLGYENGGGGETSVCQLPILSIITKDGPSLPLSRQIDR